MTDSDDHVVLIELSDSLVEAVQNELPEMLGVDEGQKIEHVVYAWMSEHGYLDYQGDE